MKKLEALTGARFVAAGCVVLFHFGSRLSIPPALLRLFDGPAAVSFFFVLSGFILAYNYEGWFREGISRQLYKRFLLLRFARVYPIHLFVMLIITPITILAWYQNPGVLANLVGAPMSAVDLAVTWVANVTLTMVYIPELSFIMPWNTPAWSIAAEALFYVLFPFIVMSASRIGSRGWILASLLAAYGAQIVLILAAASMLGLFHPMGYPWYRFNLGLYGMPPFRVPEFAIGVLTGIYFLRAPPSQPAGRHLRGMTIAVLSFIVLFLLLPRVTGHFEQPVMVLRYCTVYTLPFAALIYLLAVGRTPIAGFLSTRPLQILGEASYSLYMVHWVGLMTWNYWLNWGPLATWGLVLSLIPVSILMFKLIENPARRALSGAKIRHQSFDPTLSPAATVSMPRRRV